MGTRRTPTAASVFAAEDDEEEERPARRLVPIEYTPKNSRRRRATRSTRPEPRPGAADASASERAKSAAAAIEANIRRVAAESEAAEAAAPTQTKGAIFAREVNWSAYAEGNGRARAATAAWTKCRVAELLGGGGTPRWWNWCWRRRTSDCLPTRWSKRSNPCWTPRRNRSCWTFGASYSKRRGARRRVGTRESARAAGDGKTPSQDTQILIVTYSSVHHTDGLFVTWRRRTRNRELTTPPRMGADDPSSRLRPSSLRHPG